MIGETKAKFPVTYATYETHMLLDAFRLAPARYRKIISDISDENLRKRVRGPNKWSIFEIVIHLVDSELMGATRVKLAIAQPGQEFSAYNQDIWANVFEYNKYSRIRFDKLLDLFDLLRWQTNAHFETIQNVGDWQNRWGIHKEFGEITVRNLLELYADHSERHIVQINEARVLLGLPVTVPVMLSERLY